MTYRVCIIAICWVLLVGCGLAPSAPAEMSPVASAYLDEVFAIMERRALHRETRDWKRLRWQASQLADGAETTSDTHAALRFVVSQLGDNHSRFIPAAEVHQLAATSSAAVPRGELLAGRIGSIWLPHAIGDGTQAGLYARTAQSVIRELDASAPCGWIVDLRDNQGGNMWPMLAGIGPLLGEGEAGRFVDPTGTSVSWSYQDGAALFAEEVMVQIERPAYVLKRPDAFVAVLTSKHTASSGEAIAVAFRGRARTRSFGEPTAGLSTGNETYHLSDGAVLILTEVRFADRTGVVYGEAITPDEQVWLGGSARERAVTWLLDQGDCAA